MWRGHRLILIQGMSDQDGHQKFQHLGLRSVMIGLLFEGHSLEVLDQAEMFGKPAPSHQKGVLRVIFVE